MASVPREDWASMEGHLNEIGLVLFVRLIYHYRLLVGTEVGIEVGFEVGTEVEVGIEVGFEVGVEVEVEVGTEV